MLLKYRYLILSASVIILTLTYMKYEFFFPSDAKPVHVSLKSKLPDAGPPRTLSEIKPSPNSEVEANPFSPQITPTPIIITLKIEPDSSKRFGIIRSVFSPTEPHQNNDLSMVIHMDISKVQNAVDMANNYQGPIQACIFIASEDMLNDTVNLLSRFRNTDANVEKHVDWHILYPLKPVGPNIEHFIEDLSFTGKSTEVVDQNLQSYPTTFEDALNKLVDSNFKASLKGSTRNRVAFYPQTIAMNVAVNASKTMYFLSMDGDLIPSIGMRNKFISFANKHNLFAEEKPYPPISKIIRTRKETDGVCFDHTKNSLPPPDIYVVPTFMTKEKETPRTVKKMRVSMQTEMSNFFYGGLYDPSYGPTNHKKWLEGSDDDENATIECLYEVAYRNDWESFVIARKSIPRYDERFTGFSQVEDHHKNLLGHLQYKFKVLGNVFLVHDSWKTSASMAGQKRTEADYHHKDWTDFLKWTAELKANKDLEITD